MTIKKWRFENLKITGTGKKYFSTRSALCVLAFLSLLLVGSALPSYAGTRTVVDQTGNKVTVPSEINRIAIASIWPLPSVYCLFEGSAEKLVGIGETSMSAARHSMLAKVMPGIVNVSTGYLKNGALNIEELLGLKPDVVFYNADNPMDKAAFANVGIPAVGFSTSLNGSDTIATLEGWVKLLGEVLNQENRATGIVEYGRQVRGDIVSTLAAQTDLKMPRAFILFEYDDNIMTTTGHDAFGQYWLDSTGAVNVARELEGYPEISMEQIYKWDPEIIYITNFSPHLAEDLLNNTVSGQDWKNVNAVKNGRVYKFPLGMYRWYPPASDTPLVLKWLATKNQPKLFKNIDMEHEVRDYYKRFYGVELTDENLYQIFHPSRAAAN
jgi:iron complex transport system substrate-binding protein